MAPVKVVGLFRARSWGFLLRSLNQASQEDSVNTNSPAKVIILNTPFERFFNLLGKLAESCATVKSELLAKKYTRYDSSQQFQTNTIWMTRETTDKCL